MYVIGANAATNCFRIIRRIHLSYQLFCPVCHRPCEYSAAILRSKCQMTFDIIQAVTASPMPLSSTPTEVFA
jgi:hypothetical protein